MHEITPAQYPPAPVRRLQELRHSRSMGSLTESSDLSLRPSTVFEDAFESPNQSRHSSMVFNAMALASLLNQANPRISPCTPESVGRYTPKVSDVVPDEPTQYTIRPFTSIDSVPPPLGWKTCLHPEGAQYFFHKEKRVFTDANLFDNRLLKFINDYMGDIDDFCRAHGVQLEPHIDLVLDEFLYSDDSRGCQYYFVNHQKRCVFWLDETTSNMFSVCSEVNGMSSPSHFRHELEAQYWRHCELFPLSLQVTPEIVKELRSIVLHSLGDLITSTTSTVPWKVDDLNHMVKLIDGLSHDLPTCLHSAPLTRAGTLENVENDSGGPSCVVGRLMYSFVRARVYNFYGEPGARLDSTQSVYATVHRRSLLLKLLNPLLFYAPDFHLDRLHAIYTDRLIRPRQWFEFIMELRSQWQEFTLNAVVMLNAGVAFLSIQSVDQGGSSKAARSPAQISSYLSILMSIGAIVIGLLLVKQNRNREYMTADKAADYISKRTHPKLGLETLAILHSLPYAMLVWSMVSFLAAFSFMCFGNANFVTRTLVAVIWGIVAVLILWCIFNECDNDPEVWAWRLLFKMPCAEGHAGSAREEHGDEDAAGTDVQSSALRAISRRQRWLWPFAMFHNWPVETVERISMGV
ncbi:hypothetical protein GGX14DRAFT_432111 [Mycena pura]|uniref:WW domain-containing protein n=1 Tax=Mycena pura TaxID=153505 RepID=A0AAD6YGX1_9AGAR|nr:hypothetical protein GGX14DRAFT_432111 [Mycena pura]